METIDAYVHCIIQVATLLDYQEPQILEVFKDTLPTKLYWVLFPVMDLRQAVETASKRNFDKGKDRQTVSRTDFLNSVHEHKRRFNKKVTCDMADNLEQKIDKLMVMMGKLVT